MKNLFNFNKDVSYFKEFWRELMKGTKKVPLLNLSIRMFLVVFKWGIIAAAIVCLILFIVAGIKYSSGEKKSEDIYSRPEKITKEAETFNVKEKIKIGYFSMIVDSLEDVPEIVKEYVYKIERGRKEIVGQEIKFVKVNFTLRNDGNIESDFSSFGFEMVLESDKGTGEGVKLVWRESGLQAYEWEENINFIVTNLT